MLRGCIHIGDEDEDEDEGSAFYKRAKEKNNWRRERASKNAARDILMHTAAAQDHALSACHKSVAHGPRILSSMTAREEGTREKRKGEKTGASRLHKPLHSDGAEVGSRASQHRTSSPVFALNEDDEWEGYQEWVHEEEDEVDGGLAESAVGNRVHQTQINDSDEKREDEREIESTRRNPGQTIVPSQPRQKRRR